MKIINGVKNNSLWYYNFKTSKPILFVLSFFISIIGAAFLLIVLDSMSVFVHKDNTFYFIFSCGVFLISNIFFIRLIAFTKIEITLESDIISLKWPKRFLYNNKPDVTLSFNEIAAYIVKNDLYWDWLKIEMTDGSTYKIYHSSFLTKDDYPEFISAFISFVEDYNVEISRSSANSDLTAKPKTIKHAKSIYESTGGIVLAGFAIVVIFALPILLFIVPSTKEPNYFLFGVGYIGAVYYVIQVYTYRKRNKTNDKP